MSCVHAVNGGALTKQLSCMSINSEYVDPAVILKPHDASVSKIPIKGERNILITAALPYVNNVPHLGNIIGSLLSADVYARYCRSRGFNTLFISGTDEYGTATETKAIQEKVSCRELCDRYFDVHDKVYKWFGISMDCFGRSATPLQTEITQEIFSKLNSNGFIFEDSVDQLHCDGCNRFLADRFVEGQCIHCGFDDARGDQCDKCGRLLNAATDLISPRCKLDSSTPTSKASKHLFLDLQKLQKQCEDWAGEKISNKQYKWSNNSIDITKDWFSRGLLPRCITRDLQWGTPVPIAGFENKVFYVWFDACIGYISITANFLKDVEGGWEKWWKNNENVQLVQFMGKDNVPFHTVVFPSSLLGTGSSFTMLHSVSTTEYLQYENGKFSKSRNSGVFGDQVAETDIPVSVWRYYLLVNRPEVSDTVFSWDDFQSKNNCDLVANLGNFVSRVTKFVSKQYEGRVPCRSVEEGGDEFIEKAKQNIKIYFEHFENLRLKAALKQVFSLLDICNAYLTSSGLTGALFVEKKDKCSSILNRALNMIYVVSALLFPFIPETSEAIVRQLNLPLRNLSSIYSLDSGVFDVLPLEHFLGQPEHLFKRIDNEQIARFREMFSGHN